MSPLKSIIITGTLFFLTGMTLVVLGNYAAGRYERETPLAVQEQHKELAWELQKLPKGTFVKDKGGKLLLINRPEFPEPTRNIHVQTIYVAEVPGSEYGIVAALLARRADKIIRRNDPEWPEAAYTFLTQ